MAAACQYQRTCRPFRERLKEAAKAAGVEYRQSAIGRALGISKQTVDMWMNDGRPSPELLYKIADTWKINPRWLAIEEGQMRSVDPSLTAREEIVLDLYRGLTPEQQREHVQELRAAYEANRQVQTYVAKPLRTFSNEDVERAFGKVPGPKKVAKRQSGRARGGLIEDDPE